MGVAYVQDEKHVILKSKRDARLDFQTFSFFTMMSGVLIPFLYLLHPVLGAGMSGVYLFYALYEMHREYFSSKMRYALYERILAPKMARSHYVQIGYEVPDEEIEWHKSIVEKLDVKGKTPEEQREKEEAKKLLAQKAKRVLRDEKYRVVGLSKNQLTTHFWILGTTGAGKTSFLMTLFKEHMKNGGGLIFVDGKADEKMASKLYTLAQESGRETDFYLINFLNTERFREDTNTINPLASLPPAQAVEFLSSLMGEATGDGQYWQGRGKALLRPIIFFLSMRKRFYGENFSYETVQTYFDYTEVSFIAVVIQTMMMELEEKLVQDHRIDRLYEEARRYITPKSKFERVECLRSYYIQFPHRSYHFTNLGYSKEYLEALYSTYNLTMNYISGVSTAWKKACEEVANLLYQAIKGRAGEMSIVEFRKAHEEVINKALEQLGDNKDGSSPVEQYANPASNPDMMQAIQQHQYAQQQWTDIFSSLEMYSHIFGALSPDVDMVDVIRNNKVLYILLPPLKQSASTTTLLGKMMILAMRQAVATALGGPVELTTTQKDIVKEIITPKPLGLMVFDEYGAYPIAGIDTFLAQVRSINISVLLATQDYTSARVEGRDENSVKRAWGNTQKLVLRIKDNETIRELQSQIKEVVRKSFRGQHYGGQEIEKEPELVTEKAPWFDPRELTGFKNGFCMILTDDIPVIAQIFWADAPESDEMRLTHFEDVV